jgi:hypothetical protein
MTSKSGKDHSLIGRASQLCELSMCYWTLYSSLVGLYVFIDVQS